MQLRSLLVVPLLGFVTPVAAAQTPAAAPAEGARVGGVVYDSIARMPLAGATVQLASMDDRAGSIRSAIADPLGRFGWDSVPDGRYVLGFMHPMLDSLALQPPLRAVTVDGGRPVRVDLAIPSAGVLRTAICQSGSPDDSSAVIMGFVRDAERHPAAGVTVTAQWVELSIGRGGIQSHVAGVAATTAENGWFAMCGVPRGGAVGLMAARAADTTAQIEVAVPADGLLRQELYLGSAETVVLDPVRVESNADTIMLPPRRMQRGTGRLSGTVVAAAGGRPLADAQVSLADGPQTRSNERGEWTLTGAPTGTRILEVRAIGYYPEQRTVHVVGAAAPVHVALSTFKAVMDTVKVTATRLYDRDRSGFQQRRRTGAGRYVTAEDIARRRPLYLSDLFRQTPSIRVSYAGGESDKRIFMRGTFAGWCSPTVYVDGMRMHELTASDLDGWVKPADVAGIEIYSVASVPAQYQALNGCGAVVIWTK